MSQEPEKEILILDKLLSLLRMDANTCPFMEMVDIFCEIQDAIDTHDNNFFERLDNNSLIKQMFNCEYSNQSFYNDISGTGQIMSNEKMGMYIEQLKEKSCTKHKWVHDSIDISPERSENICYCSVCEVTKR